LLLLLLNSASELPIDSVQRLPKEEVGEEKIIWSRRCPASAEEIQLVVGHCLRLEVLKFRRVSIEEPWRHRPGDNSRVDPSETALEKSQISKTKSYH
jgi:hypothetical protein